MRETIVQSESGREITTASDMTRSKDQDDDRYHVQILSRAIAVLFTFTPRTPEMTLDAFAERLDLNKTSLLRILRTLEHERFVIREGERYRLGPRVLELGNVYLSSLSVQEIARGPMERLARELGQTVSLAILDGLDVVYIGIEHAQREVGIQGEVGGRHLAHATGLGKVMLADLDDDRLEALLSGTELKRLTHRTIVDPVALRERLRTVRAAGYALDDEERAIGIRCVAAPIFDHRGRVIAAMSVAGPIFHMLDEDVPEVRDKLLAAVASVSERLGHEPPVATVST